MVHVAVISVTKGTGTETLVLLWAAESENETQGAQKWAAMLLIFQSHWRRKKDPWCLDGVVKSSFHA